MLILTSSVQWLFTLGLALSAIIDVLITLTLCFYLRDGLNGFSRYAFSLWTYQLKKVLCKRLLSMDGVIHRLLLYTINNGLLTSMASVLAMIFVSN